MKILFKVSLLLILSTLFYTWIVDWDEMPPFLAVKGINKELSTDIPLTSKVVYSSYSWMDVIYSVSLDKTNIKDFEQTIKCKMNLICDGDSTYKKITKTLRYPFKWPEEKAFSACYYYYEEMELYPRIIIIVDLDNSMIHYYHLSDTQQNDDPRFVPLSIL